MARDNFTGANLPQTLVLNAPKFIPVIFVVVCVIPACFLSLCAHHIQANTMPRYLQVSLCSLAACRPVSSVSQPPQTAAIPPQRFHGGSKSCRRQGSSAFTCQTSTWICPPPCPRLSALCPVYSRSVLFPCLVGSSRRGAETKHWLRHDVRTSTGGMFISVGKKTTSSACGSN